MMFDDNLDITFYQVKKIIKQLLIKRKKLEAILYNLSSMLFILHRSMETEPQRESSKLIGKECDNGERKKKRIRNSKEAKECLLKQLEENHLTRNWMNRKANQMRNLRQVLTG